MKIKRRTIKIILITIASLIGIIVIGVPLMIWLAFGPINSSGDIEIKDRIEVEYEQIYNGDFAGEFYDVTFTLNKVKIGFYTFHHKDWEDFVIVDSLDNRYFILIPDSSYKRGVIPSHYLISFTKNQDDYIDEVYPPDSSFDLLTEMNRLTDE